jgi:transposase
MGQKRRSFTRDYKLSVLAEVEGDRSVVEVAREHGIHANVITRWKREYAKNPDACFSGNGNMYKDEARIAKLEREIGRLHMEKEFLKKNLELLGKRVQEEKKRSRSRRGSP